ncbi:10624_t:CDS:2, partial [Funneliformis mosseae]
FLKDSSKNLQINLSYKNNTLLGLIRTGRNFYLSPEYSKIFEHDFSQNFPAANYFGVEREFGVLQRYKIYQEEN